MSPQKNYSLNEIINKILTWYSNLDVFQQAVVAVIVLKILADLSPKTYYTPKPKPIPRKDFTESTKKIVLLRQGFRCNSCRGPIDVRDFHHINGNSFDNRSSNCQALCPNCHAKMTRRKN